MLDASGTSFPSTPSLGATCGSDGAGCDDSGSPVLRSVLPAGTYYAVLDGAAAGDTALTCDNQDMELLINGVTVGPVIIAPSAAAVTPSFSFAAIAGPSYTFRLQTTRTVNSGCGSAGLPDASSIDLNPAP